MAYIFHMSPLQFVSFFLREISIGTSFEECHNVRFHTIVVSTVLLSQGAIIGGRQFLSSYTDGKHAQCQAKDYGRNTHLHTDGLKVLL